MTERSATALPRRCRRALADGRHGPGDRLTPEDQEAPVRVRRLRLLGLVERPDPALDTFAAHLAGMESGGNVTLVFSRPPANLVVTSGGGDITILLPPGQTEYAITDSRGGGDYSRANPVKTPEEMPERIGGNFVFFPLAPLMHGAAQWTVFAWLFVGGTNVLTPSRPRTG